MNDVFSLAVGVKQRSDKEHGGPGGADEAGDAGADGEEDDIGAGVSGEVALETDAAGDDIEAKEQDDKGDVFGEDGVVEDLVDGFEVGDELVGVMIDDPGVNEPII